MVAMDQYNAAFKLSEAFLDNAGRRMLGARMSLFRQYGAMNHGMVRVACTTGAGRCA